MSGPHGYRSRGRKFAVFASLAIVATGESISVDTLSAPVADPKASVSTATYQMLYENPVKVVPYIEDLAWRGDARAQLLLGTILLDGKLVPRDRARAHAWLHVTADGGPWQYFADGSPSKAREVLFHSIAEISGKELIQADRIAAQLRAELMQDWQGGIERQVQALTGQRPLSAEPLVLSRSAAHVITLDPATLDEGTLQGCAAAPSLKGCKMPANFGSETHCTGLLPTADAVAKLNGAGIVTRQPTYPEICRRDGAEGRVGLLLHVDHTGWVCSVTVHHSSGVPQFDRSALEAIRLWRVLPAQQAGVPIESLYLVNSVFALKGYAFTTWDRSH